MVPYDTVIASDGAACSCLSAKVSVLSLFPEVVSKPIFGVILNQPRQLKLGKNHPPFSKGGQGGLNKRLIIPLNSPLGKGDLKLPFPTSNWLGEHMCSQRPVLQ